MAGCSVAIEKFLQANPIFWCFIPLHTDEALSDNAIYMPSSTMTGPTVDYVLATTTINNPAVNYYMNRVPSPMAPYAFSYRQIRQQRSFFEYFLSTATNYLHYKPVYICKVAIVAVCK